MRPRRTAGRLMVPAPVVRRRRERDAMNAEDRAMAKAITQAIADLDRPKVVDLIRQYYGDGDRADRTPRALLMLHLGMAGGPWDHNGECLFCDGHGEHEPGCTWPHPVGCPCMACIQRKGEAVRTVVDAAQKAVDGALKRAGKDGV